MFRLAVFQLALLIMISPALAQTAPNSAQNPPRAIWDFDLDGTAIHQQSKLECPKALKSFYRTDVKALNPAGLDVVCEYGGPAGVISIFVTKYEDKSTLSDVFEGAKQAILKSLDAVPRSDALKQPAGFDWLEAGYTIQDGKFKSDLLLASLSE